MDGDRIFLGHTTTVVQASITRPNDAVPYTPGDVVADGNGVYILDFADVARSPGGSGLIPSAKLIDSANQATPPAFDLVLFTVAPLTAQADNSPCATTDAELLSLVGIIPLNVASSINQAAAAAGNLVLESSIVTESFKCAGGTTHLKGMLIVRNAYTPVALETLTVKIPVLQDY